MAHKSMPNRKLEAARLHKRWSVEVVSKKVGVSVNTFNRWERGLQLPQLETLNQLCNVFEMSPEELGFAHVITGKRRMTASHLAQPATPLIDSPSIDRGRSFSDIIEVRGSIVDVQVSRQELSIEQVRKNFDVNSLLQDERQKGSIQRREAMALLVRTPAAVFDMAQGTLKPLLSPNEILLLSTVNLPLCWQIYFEGGLLDLRNILPGYLLQLSILARDPSSYQKQAAYLASQAHQLSYLLALQQQDFGTSLKHTQEALRYGEIAEDIDLQVAALVRKAYVYYCLHRSTQRLQSYQEALRFGDICSPLLRGYIYAGLAEVYAHNQNEAKAITALQMAHHHYPDHPEEDITYSYTHFRRATYYNFAGQVYLRLNRPQEAQEAFAHVEQLVPPNEEPYLLELAVNQTDTALELGELELACTLLETAIHTARALGSELRYSEACQIYERMQARWPNERRVQALADLIQ